MTQEQLLRAMTNIDDTFVLEAMPRTEQKQQRRRTRGWLGYAAAACLGLLVCGSLLWQMVKPVPAKAFEIEDGVLLAYHGTDAEVVIPDEVTKISASAFATAPSPEGITSLHIGENVAEIEEDALAPLTLLDTVTVAEENEFFEVVDGVLARKDGTIKVDTQREYADSMDALVDAVHQITLGEISLGEELKITFGKAVISVIVEENPKYKTGEDDRAYNCYMTAIDFEGAHLELARVAPMMSNSVWNFYQAEDILIYTNINKSGYGEGYLLANGRVTQITNPQMRNYNDSIYFYGVDDKGNVIYQRQPNKYVDDNETGTDLMYCTGPDEMFMEEGYVTLDGGELVYTPTAIYTVGEVWDLQEKFEAYHSMNEYALANGYTKESLEEIGRCACNTLEELFEFNLKRYESWK